MSEIHYVRITPYDEKKGALCQRLTVGGMLFVAGNWYELEAAAAARLGDLEQNSGAPYFEIVKDEDDWKEIVRRELAAAMGGPQAAALASLFTSPKPEKSPTPRKAGEVIKSSFDGLRGKEIEPKAAVKKAAADLAPTPVSSELDTSPEPEAEDVLEDEDEGAGAGEKLDLDGMTKRELLELAEDLGLDDVDSKTRKADVLSAVKAARK